MVVTTGANAGMANPAVRAQKYQQLMGLMRQPGMNQRWILEQNVSQILGSNAVDKAMLPEGGESMPAQRREAMMENTSFGQGIALPVAPEDAHFEHIEEHLKPIMPIAQQFVQTGQATPEQTAASVIGLEHAGVHMQYLSQDQTMKEQFQMVNGPYQQIQSVVRGMLKQAQVAAQQNQQQPQPIR